MGILGLVLANWSVPLALVAVGGLVIFRYALVSGSTLSRSPDGPTLFSRLQRLFETGVAWQDSPAFDPETYLLDAGLLHPDAEDFDLRLDPAFERDWYDEYDGVRDQVVRMQTLDETLLADLVGIDASRLLIEWYDDAFVAWVDDLWLGRWESRVAFLADVAADRLLADQLDDWNELSIGNRSVTLGVLRLFIERCPACDGMVSLEATVERSCCRETDVIATTCRGCGERLFEAVADPAEMQTVVAGSLHQNH